MNPIRPINFIFQTPNKQTWELPPTCLCVFSVLWVRKVQSEVLGFVEQLFSQRICILFPSTLTNFPSPAAANNPHIMKLPSPCFTVETVFGRWWWAVLASSIERSVLCPCQRCVPFLIRSDQFNLPQVDSGQGVQRSQKRSRKIEKQSVGSRLLDSFSYFH